MPGQRIAQLYLTREELQALELCVKRALGSSHPQPAQEQLWPLHTALCEARTGLDIEAKAEMANAD
jgi:hypothetical protein